MGRQVRLRGHGCRCVAAGGDGATGVAGGEGPPVGGYLAALQAEARKLETERDILRQAAKYFAGETNW